MLLRYLVLFLSSFSIVLFLIPKIITVSFKKNLVDDPSEDRKIHLTKIPNLGGVAIVIGTLFTGLFFLPDAALEHFNYMLGAGMIVFKLGLADDLVGTKPYIKILAQLAAALIVTLPGHLYFTSLYGFLGIFSISQTSGIILTVLFILLVVNAFNLIDGINWLAGSIVMLVLVTFSLCFWKLNDIPSSMLAATFCGSLLAFLIYNKTPARVFMGDTGSLFLGFVISLLSIHFLELTKVESANTIQPIFTSAPAIILAMLIIPVFDTARVFCLRVLKGVSPFVADRTHIHHRFIDLKFSHLQTTGVLVLVNLIVLVAAFFFPPVNSSIFFAGVIIFMLILNRVLSYYCYRKAEKPVINGPTSSKLTTV